MGRTVLGKLTGLPHLVPLAPVAEPSLRRHA
jgi:hypothetical protein